MVAVTTSQSLSKENNCLSDLPFPRTAYHLSSREELIADINVLRERTTGNGRSILVIVTLIGSKSYDNIVRIFGFSVAEVVKTLRIESLGNLDESRILYDIGHWSIAVLFLPSKRLSLDTFLTDILAELSSPVICRGVSVHVKAGVGICDLAKCHSASEDILQLTYSASKAGVSSASGWAESRYDLESDQRKTFSLVADFENSLNGEAEFDVYYQPRQSLKDLTFGNAEALFRWHHPQLGIIPPAEIVPLAEVTGQIRNLTRYVLGKAIRDAKRWHQRGVLISVSVNISPLNLEEEDFVDILQRLLKKFEFNPTYLDLELSESKLCDDVISYVSRIQRIREIGPSISIDDFGASGRNLLYLAQLPVKYVKLDSMLLRCLRNDPKGDIIIRSCIELAHGLGIETVAEGVESRKSLSRLASLGCDYAQGFCIEEPMGREEFNRWTFKASPHLLTSKV